MLGVLLGLALAAPPAVIGPSGPVWLGPLPPQGADGHGAPWSDLIVVVSPLSGQLYVQERDAPEVLRVWDGVEWTVDGAPITETWPVRREAAYTLTEAGRLAAVGGLGGDRRLVYDADGRLTRLRWPDGNVLSVEHDEEGRVTALRGPGLSRWRFEWGDAGLRAIDPLGRPTTFRLDDRGGQRLVEVQDALGRTARSWYTEDGTLQSIEDPRGLRLDWTVRGPLSRLQDSLARVWTLQHTPDGALTRLELPGGASWSWGYDSSGRLTRLQDPTGRLVRWERDRAGRIDTETNAGAVTRYSRDAAGRVVAISSPTGAITRLTRDASGDVIAILDAAGNQISIERYPGGMPMRITDAVGGRWRVGLDLQGRPDLVEDPTGRSILLGRGPLGRLRRIEDSRYGVTDLKRGASGELNGITGPEGTWGIVRDALGRPVTVREPSGRSWQLDRDILGEISRLTSGETFEIRRDSAGRPVEAGPMLWRWGATGLVEVTGPGVAWQLGRDAAGRLERVVADGGAQWLQFTRDFRGAIVAWEGLDGVDEVSRDASGAIVSSGDDTVRVGRGLRGAVERLTTPQGTWRWLRDAAGRVLRRLGPHELSLGFVRDDAGRVTLSRLSTGPLLRRRWVEASVLERVEDSRGQLIFEQLTAADRRGHVVQQQGLRDGTLRHSYDRDGRLSLVEGEQGALYSRTPEGSFGPGEAMALFDASGRLMEAQLTAGAPAWHVGQRTLSAFWSADGVLDELVGDQGMARLQHDSFGRLTEIAVLDEGAWRLGYDIRGRLRSVTPPDGGPIPLRWSPTGELLAIGDRAILFDAAGAAQVWATDGGAGGLTWLRGGTPGWRHGSLAQGWPRLLPSGAIEVFEGGPHITAEGAIEPISEVSTVTAPRVPWAGGRAALLPDALRPSTPWHAPLGLLEAAGVLGPLDRGDWAMCPRGEEGGRWPDAVPHPPLGPSAGSLPISDDPITVALICSVLPGGSPLEADSLAVLLLEVEAEVVDVPAKMLDTVVTVRRE